MLSTFGSSASETEMNPELMESHRQLMDKLASEPVVNKGSDGVLSQLPKQTPATIEAGVAVYHQHCAHCHGSELQGQPDWDEPIASGLLPAPPHDDSGHTWHHADDQLIEIVKYGPATAMGDPEYRSMMPAFQSVLSDQQISAVLVFIRSTWSQERKDWQCGANDAQTGKVWWRKE